MTNDEHPKSCPTNRRVEDKFVAHGIVVPDDFEEALRQGKVRRQHLDKLYSEHGADLEQYLVANALRWRTKRVRDLLQGLQLHVGLRSGDRHIRATRPTRNSTPRVLSPSRQTSHIHSVTSKQADDSSATRSRHPGAATAPSRCHVLKTPDALQLRTRIHDQRIEPPQPDTTSKEHDPDLYLDFRDQPEPTLMTCLFPWLAGVASPPSRRNVLKDERLLPMPRDRSRSRGGSS